MDWESVNKSIPIFVGEKIVTILVIFVVLYVSEMYLVCVCSIELTT